MIRPTIPVSERDRADRLQTQWWRVFWFSVAVFIGTQYPMLAFPSILISVFAGFPGIYYMTQSQRRTHKS